MSLTDYHAKYIAFELTRRFPSDSPERLAGAVASAQVDLNPHQVDAALFAFASPLSKGALLADEVGLGKTIEAGLVLSQRWAERRRRILVITPSNLRKQWFQELTEKFFLPCRLLEAKSYNAAIRHGQFRPFEVPEVVICSYQFAKSRAADVQATAWDLVSDYLQRNNLQALPASQRSLMTLVLRKLLASSTFAIAGALTTIADRLRAKAGMKDPGKLLEDNLDQDYEALDETAEEWTDDTPVEPLSETDRAALEREIADLDAFAQLAASFDHNAKGRALLKALGVAFAKAKSLGAPEKAIIFTESRRTQSYLLRLLADSPHQEGIVLFNGSNTDERSRHIYAQWYKRHQGTDRVTGSRTADMRSALVDYFRDQGRIMIATEAGAEGINLQFCIAAIYQRCRRPQEIQNAFDQLQLELSFEIDTSMARTRAQLLENFDDEVCEKLRVREETAKASLTRYERLLMQLTRHELSGAAEFIGDASFRLHRAPPDAGAGIPLGLYELPRRSGEAHLYRLNHPLAEALLANAKRRDLPLAEIRFDYGRHPGKISLIEPLIGRSGWLSLSLLRVESLDQGEDHLIFAAVTDDGEPLDSEAVARLMTVPGSSSPLPRGEGLRPREEALGAQTTRQRVLIERQVSERNARFFEAEAQKLDGWADDLKVGLEREIKEMDHQIREARRAATAAVTLEEKLAGQRQVKALEGERSRKRRSLFDAQDGLDRQRDRLIAETEAKLAQALSLQALFSIRWSIQ